MKKTNEKTVAKTATKTIKKAQTIDVSAMKVLAVTLNENGTMSIKYVKA